jgi:hypothetical protein
MKNNQNISRAGNLRNSWARTLLVASAVIGISASGAALAQTALVGSDLLIPATAPTADMIILKTEGIGGVLVGNSNKYTIVVTNTGPVAVTGAVVTDNGGVGGLCPKDNPVAITGDGVPAGGFTIANLKGAGIALGTLEPGQSATLTYSCQAK